MDKCLAHRYINEKGLVIEQPLAAHLLTVGEECQNRAEKIGLGSLAYLIGCFHDLGKASSLFQRLLRGENLSVNHSTAGAYFLFRKGKTFLKNAGKESRETMSFLCFLTYPILQHHGLFDVVNFSLPQKIQGMEIDLYPFYRLLQKNSEEDFIEVQDFAESFAEDLSLRLDECLEMAFHEWQLFDGRIHQMAMAAHAEGAYPYYQACGIRLLLSILKEADIYDSSNYFRALPDRRYGHEEKKRIWDDGQRRMEEMAKRFEEKSKATALDQVRSRLSKACKASATVREKGLFTLELPTGAGKTASVLRFALNHAAHFNDQRIFYTTAFLSVLEQSAESIRNFLGNQEYILEHHSNVVQEETEEKIGANENDRENRADREETAQYQYLIESWESPIILTTLVQMTNSLFGGKSAQIRRFCKLIESVIIMDEVQSLPLKAITNMNLMTNFLTEIMGATVIHCTATTPIYDHPLIAYPARYQKIFNGSSSLAEVKEEERSCFNRVTFFSLLGPGAKETLSVQDFCDQLKKEMQKARSALVICNKKVEVMAIYQALLGNPGEGMRGDEGTAFDAGKDREERKDSEEDLIYLTTNLCPAHRLDKIHQMDLALKANRRGENHRLICVSTQLVEAGVDLDFDLVFREAAGLDSLIQSAGRCNREGKRAFQGSLVPGKCFSFRLQADELKSLPTIQWAQDALLAAMRKTDDQGPFHPKDLKEEYFTRYYQAHPSSMDYPLPSHQNGGSVFDLLSSNQKNLNDLATQAGDRRAFKMQADNFPLHQNFRTASENFHLIEEKNQRTVLVPYNNEDLLDQIFEAERTQNYPLAKKFIQRASLYSVDLPQNFIEAHPEAYFRLFQDRIFILQKDWYDSKFGVNLDHPQNLPILVK